jgi:hypothetical protein
VKSYYEWLQKFKEDYQLIVAVQGWDIFDYLNMYRNYVKLGITHIAFGGLARSPTSFIINLVDKLMEEIKTSKKLPAYLHFFGLARFVLFSKFQEIEDLGIEVGFDSASYLRKAWLSTPTSQLNYLTINGKGYTAIRIPFVKKMQRKTQKSIHDEINLMELTKMEQETLNQLRLYDKGETDLENAISILSKFAKAISAPPELIKFYKRTLEEKPWKLCECPICKKIGIDVVIFRGNNRNRRRGFHNIYTFYNVLKNPQLWTLFIKKPVEELEFDLTSLRKGDRVLIITECSKQKLGYNSSVKKMAKDMYRGRLFKAVRKFCERMEFDYVIISAKHGLIFPEQIIEGYEKEIQTNKDVENIRSVVEDKLKLILEKYDKIIVVAGEKYRRVLQGVWDDRFISVRSKGYGDLCRIIENATERTESLLKYVS